MESKNAQALNPASTTFGQPHCPRCGRIGANPSNACGGCSECERGARHAGLAPTPPAPQVWPWPAVPPMWTPQVTWGQIYVAN